MIVLLAEDMNGRGIEAISAALSGLGLTPRPLEPWGGVITAEGRSGERGEEDQAAAASRLPGVVGVRSPGAAPWLATRDFRAADTVLPVGTTWIGGGGLTVLAGPCAVESRECILSAAAEVKKHGATVLRGGAFKARGSPYSFRGLGLEGLKLLAEASAATGLPVVTEVLRPEDAELTAGYVDILQIGTRNMQNWPLLEAAADTGRPVLLKRGFMSTVDELLVSAEYLMRRGNGRVILCERGIRTFEPGTRNTLDLAAVPRLKEESHLPVVVDPSHAAGRRELVPALALAAAAAGADGLVIEVHPDPDQAWSDGPQSLDFQDFGRLMVRLRAVVQALGGEVRGGGV
ncbi:MAG: 3-deoxy-7-phosphoheptulonate synthase [Thermodesulfobacteriota bacterium]